MTRQECLEKIAFDLYSSMKEVGLEDYTTPESNWKMAEVIYLFWFKAKRGELSPKFMSSEDYEDYLRFKDICYQSEENQAVRD